MRNWVENGDTLLNIDNVEFVERTNSQLVAHLVSGKTITITSELANRVWVYLLSQRIQFLDNKTPTRSFSGL